MMLALTNSVIVVTQFGLGARGEYGSLVAFTAILLPAASLGQGLAIPWLVSRGTADSCVSGVITLVNCFATLLCLVIFVPWLIFSTSTSQPQPIVGYAVVALPAIVSYELLHSFFLGHRRFVATAAIRVMMVALPLLLNVTACALALDHATVPLLTFVLAYWVVGLPAMLFFASQSEFTSAAASLSVAIRFGIRSLPTSLGETGMLRGEYVFSGILASKDILGLYAIAEQITHIASWGSLVAGKLILPESASDSRKCLTSRGLLLATCIAGIFWFCFFAICCFYFGHHLLQFAYGKATAPAILFVYALLPTTLFKVVHAPCVGWLQGQNEHIATNRAALSSAAVCVFGAPLAISLFGVNGLVLAKNCTYLVATLLGVYAVYQFSKLQHDSPRLPGPLAGLGRIGNLDKAEGRCKQVRR